MKVGGPLEQLDRWLADAREAGVEAPMAMTLATAGADGRPSARVVSLKRIEDERLVFTTALWTRKVGGAAGQLRVSPPCSSGRRWGGRSGVEGRAEIAERALAEELFAERPRSHQLQAHVSRQGEEIEGLDQLRDRLEALRAELGEGPVPCPEDWGAVRLRPDRVEFWQEGEDRLHSRQLFEASADWRIWRRVPVRSLP